MLRSWLVRWQTPLPCNSSGRAAQQQPPWQPLRQGATRGRLGCGCRCSCPRHPPCVPTPHASLRSLTALPRPLATHPHQLGPVSAPPLSPPSKPFITTSRAPPHLPITGASRSTGLLWSALLHPLGYPCLHPPPPPHPLLTMAARTAVVTVPTCVPALPPATSPGHGLGSWTAAARSAVAAMWPPRRRSCLRSAQVGLLSLMPAAPPREGGAVADAARLSTCVAARVATELADARSAATDVAGAAVAILLVLFCGLPEDEEIPGGEPLKGGWWATWSARQPRAPPADAASVAADPTPPADWAIDPESDDPFHADLSPQWRWALAVHLRVARAAVSAAQSQPAGERERQSRMTRRPSMPSICELSQLYEDDASQSDASQSAPALICS